MNGQDHSYTWGDLRERPFGELEVGRVVFKPGMGAAYRTATDGRVAGLSWVLDGSAWTITARDGDLATLVRADGEASQTLRIPPDCKVLAVLPPVLPGELKGATKVCERAGSWRDVIRVNKTTVTVKFGDSTRKIPHGEILEVKQ